MVERRRTLTYLCFGTFVALLTVNLLLASYCGSLLYFGRVSGRSMGPTISEADVILIKYNIDATQMENREIIVYHDVHGSGKVHRIFNGADDDEGRMYYLATSENATQEDKDLLRAQARTNPAWRIYPEQVEGKVIGIVDLRIVVLYFLVLLGSMGGVIWIGISQLRG